ncbi:MAG: hypothetical protein ABI433_04955 [Burkholderiaceae bacterium]
MGEINKDRTMALLLARYQRDHSGQEARKFIASFRERARALAREAEEHRAEAAFLNTLLATLMRDAEREGVRTRRRTGETPSLNMHLRDDVRAIAWDIYDRDSRVRLREVLDELHRRGIHVEGKKPGTSIGQIINRSGHWQREVSGLWSKPTEPGLSWRERHPAKKSTRRHP